MCMATAIVVMCHLRGITHPITWCRGASTGLVHIAVSRKSTNRRNARPSWPQALAFLSKKVKSHNFEC
jgi:hypothetical protein